MSCRQDDNKADSAVLVIVCVALVIVCLVGAVAANGEPLPYKPNSSPSYEDTLPYVDDVDAPPLPASFTGSEIAVYACFAADFLLTAYALEETELVEVGWTRDLLSMVVVDVAVTSFRRWISKHRRNEWRMGIVDPFIYTVKCGAALHNLNLILETQ